jgi:hypothetical protein
MPAWEALDCFLRAEMDALVIGELSRCVAMRECEAAECLGHSTARPNAGISVQVDLLVFEAAPQPLNKDVVYAPAFAADADHDPVLLQGAGKVVAGELAALIGIEDLWRAIARRRLLECLDAKIGGERVGEGQASTARLAQSMMTTR